MNKKSKIFLTTLDFKTLADIALKEKESKVHNMFYDLVTKEMLIYPDINEDKPLYQRLLKNEHRLNTELAKIIAGSIEIAMNNEEINKCLEDQ